MDLINDPNVDAVDILLPVQYNKEVRIIYNDKKKRAKLKTEK